MRRGKRNAIASRIPGEPRNKGFLRTTLGLWADMSVAFWARSLKIVIAGIRSRWVQNASMTRAEPRACCPGLNLFSDLSNFRERR